MWGGWRHLPPLPPEVRICCRIDVILYLELLLHLLPLPEQARLERRCLHEHGRRKKETRRAGGKATGPPRPVHPRIGEARP